ncbi:hypothetical protein [Lapidilactobacillus achengensis]|uniref:hypothetical protein n=1 Tax=Lapidilactobacillus achengensis TaxID=2486000 RepID=UPI0013DDF6E9|nr:hypothetical protein [Lapidilactobacillus achengensis]
MKLSLAALPLRTRLKTTPTTFQSATAVPAGCAHAQHPPTPAIKQKDVQQSERLA